MRHLSFCFCVLALALASPVTAFARDRVLIAGSITLQPFATVVATAFAERGKYLTPVVEGGGSVAGRAAFCKGVGESTLDIATSTSRITRTEIETCKANGVLDIMEVRIGFDGVVFANDLGDNFDFVPADIFDALASHVAKDGALVPNPNKTWADVNPKFPDQDILVFVPS